MKLSLVVLVAACGGGGAPSIEAFPQAYVDAQCAANAACGYADSVAACEASLTVTSFEFETIIADVKAGVIVYDADKAGACLAEHDTTCLFTGLHTADDDPCNSYLVGTIATGGACFYAAECAGGASCNTPCDNDLMCCAGTCGAARPTLVAIGGACSDDLSCAEDGYCKQADPSMDGVCAALTTTEGGPCDDVFACANPMVCSQHGANGTCYTPAAPGATCNPEAVFLDLECLDERQYCDPTAKKCVARVPAGTACPVDTVQCALGTECINGVCVKYAVAGAACDESNGPYCALGASCVDNVCTSEPSGTSCR